MSGQADRMKPLIGTDLKRFLRDYRRQHRPQGTVAALLQSVEYPVNVGAIFRLADGAGMEELVLSGITPTPPHPTIDKVARYKSKRVPWRFEEDPVAAVRGLRDEGYHMVAVELATGAVPYHEKATLAECDAAVFLPMYGKGRSLNVGVALSVVVYHFLHNA